MSTLADGASVFVQNVNGEMSAQGQGGNIVVKSSGIINAIDDKRLSANNVGSVGSHYHPFENARQTTLVAEGQELSINVDEMSGVDICGSDQNNIIIMNSTVADVAYGGMSADIINLNGGRDSIANAGNGNDIIVAKGNNHVLGGDAGNDILKVAGGSGHFLEGGYGNDKYVISQLESGIYEIHQGNAGYNERDILSLTKYNKDSFTFSIEDDNVIVGVKNLVITNTEIGAVIRVVRWNENPLSAICFKDGTITGKAINAALNKPVGPSDGTVILDSSSSNETIFGQETGDHYIIDGAEFITLNTMGGDDTVEIKKAFEANINTSAGNDTITICAPDLTPDANGMTKDSGNLQINAGAGQDTININGGFSMSIHGSDGDDIININSVSFARGGLEFMGDDGDDIITTSVTQPVYLYGGNGNDTYVVNWNGTKDNQHYVVINDGDKAFNFSIGTTGTETLVINGKSKDDFDIEKHVDSYTQEEHVSLSAKDGSGGIVIYNWRTNPMNVVTIDGISYNFSDLLKDDEPGLNDNTIRLNVGELYGTTANDVIDISMNGNEMSATVGSQKYVYAGDSVMVEAGNGNDNITVTGLDSVEVCAGYSEDKEDEVPGGSNIVNIKDVRSVVVRGAVNLTEDELLQYDAGDLKDKDAVARVEAYWAGTLKGDEINIINAADVDLVGGVGNDIINIVGRDSKSSRIEIGDSDDGNDIINISNAARINIAGGNGDDKYIIDWKTIGNGTIRQSNDPWDMEDKWSDKQVPIKQENDTLVLNGIKSTDIVMSMVEGHFEYHGQNVSEVLRIADKNNNQHYVDVAFWNENKLSSITFDDGTLSAEQVQKVLAGKDLFAEGITPADYEMVVKEVSFVGGDPGQVVEVEKGNFNTIKVNGTKADDYTWCYAKIQTDGSLLYEVYTDNNTSDGLKLGNIVVPDFKNSGIEYMLVGDAKIAIINDNDVNTYAASSDAQSYIFVGQNFDVTFTGKLNGADELDFSTLIDREWNRNVRFESSIVGDDLKLRVFKFNTDDSELTLGYVTLKDYCANNMQGNDYGFKVKNAFRRLGNNGYQFTRTILHVATGSEGEFKVAQYLAENGIKATRGVTYMGTDGADVVYTGAGRDYIMTGKGNDIVNVIDPNGSAEDPNRNARNQIITGAGDDIVEANTWIDMSKSAPAGYTGDLADYGYYIKYNDNYIRTGGGKDYVNIVGSRNNIGTGADDDRIIVRGSNNYVSGGDGNDTITFWSGGSDASVHAMITSQQVVDKLNNTDYFSNKANTLDGGAGDDKIYVRNGSEHVIRGEAGNDTIYIGYAERANAEGNNLKTATGTLRRSQIIGGAGNDNYVLVFGQNANSNGNIIDLTANASTDKDTLTIVGVKASDVHFYYNDNTRDLTVDAGQGRVNIVKGWDSTLVSVVFKDTVDGTATATLTYAQVQAKLEQPAGQDFIIDGSVSYVEGTNGDDNFVTAKGIQVSNVTIEALDGDDSFNVNMNFSTINAGAGDDVIRIVKAFETNINGGAGNDTIVVEEPDLTPDASGMVTDTGNLMIHGNEGNDDITINGGCSIEAFGDAGNDVITVDKTGFNGAIGLFGGAGDDTYILYNIGTGTIDIDNKEGTNVQENDKLIINDMNYSTLKVFYDQHMGLHLTDSDNNTISIKGWDVNRLSVIKFQNSTSGVSHSISGDEIMAAVNVLGNVEMRFASVSEVGSQTYSGDTEHDLTLKVAGNA